MPEKSILLQESFTWWHVSQAAAIPSHFLIHGEETARFLLGPQSCSIGFIFGLFWHLAVIFFPSLKIECFKLSANLGTCKWFIIWMVLMQVVEKSEDNSF